VTGAARRDPLASSSTAACSHGTARRLARRRTVAATCRRRRHRWLPPWQQRFFSWPASRGRRAATPRNQYGPSTSRRPREYALGRASIKDAALKRATGTPDRRQGRVRHLRGRQASRSRTADSAIDVWSARATRGQSARMFLPTPLRARRGSPTPSTWRRPAGVRGRAARTRLSEAPQRRDVRGAARRVPAKSPSRATPPHRRRGSRSRAHWTPARTCRGVRAAVHAAARWTARRTAGGGSLLTRRGRSRRRRVPASRAHAPAARRRRSAGLRASTDLRCSRARSHDDGAGAARRSERARCGTRSGRRCCAGARRTPSRAAGSSPRAGHGSAPVPTVPSSAGRARAGVQGMRDAVRRATSVPAGRRVVTPPVVHGSAPRTARPDAGDVPEVGYIYPTSGSRSRCTDGRLDAPAAFIGRGCHGRHWVRREGRLGVTAAPAGPSTASSRRPGRRRNGPLSPSTGDGRDATVRTRRSATAVRRPAACGGADSRRSPRFAGPCTGPIAAVLEGRPRGAGFVGGVRVYRASMDKRDTASSPGTARAIAVRGRRAAVTWRTRTSSNRRAHRDGASSVRHPGYRGAGVWDCPFPARARGRRTSRGLP
jgi:hypothetical protein